MARLWDPATREPAGELFGHTGAVTAVAFGSLPDGRVLLASGSYDHQVRLWNAATRELACELLHGHTGRVTAVAFGRLADGRVLLASAGDDDTVRLWRADSGLSISDPLASVLSKPACNRRAWLYSVSGW